MNATNLVLELSTQGIVFELSLDGSLELDSDTTIPPEAVALARDHKPALLSMLERSKDLPPCPKCTGPLLAIPTFDGFENFECVRCDRCIGCRRANNA